MNAQKHERRVVGHISGWKEQMPTCVCGHQWPCPKSEAGVAEQLANDRRLYGSSFERVDIDGTRTRIDPRTVTIKSAP